MKFDKLSMVLETEIERLATIDLSDDLANMEIDRGRTIARLAKTSVDNASISLEIERFKLEHCKKNSDLPKILQTKEV